MECPGHPYLQSLPTLYGKLKKTELHVYTGVPHTLAKLAVLLYPSLWLLVPGLSSYFRHCFYDNPLLRSALVSNMLENGYKILQAPGMEHYCKTRISLGMVYDHILKKLIALYPGIIIF